MKIVCFIISYNRPTFLKKQLEELIKYESLQLIVVDNCSTYQQLLDYYNELPKGVLLIKADKNYGHTVVWDLKLSEEYAKEEHYIVTDCDISTEFVCRDFIDKMLLGFIKYPNVNKIGLGLNTNRIPFNYSRRDEVIRHETKVIHRKEIGSNIFYECPIDTTFAMYRPKYHLYSVWGTNTNVWQGECKSLRMKKPYESTHLGWHIIELTEEDRFYFDSTLNTTGHWKQ